MPNFAIALLIRPFVLFALLYGAVKISRWIYPMFPDGPVRESLYKRRGP